MSDKESHTDAPLSLRDLKLTSMSQFFLFLTNTKYTLDCPDISQNALVFMRMWSELFSAFKTVLLYVPHTVSTMKV